MRAIFTGFDGTERHDAEILRPDRYRHLFNILGARHPVIARGSGLSYAAASSGPGVTSVSTERMNRLLIFDVEGGRIVVEPGVRIGDLLRFALSEGWYLPVLPGHPRITVGGCIAFNVHGKSQIHSGNFERCIDRLWIYHPEHGELECSRSKSSELFELTVGGLGMTGFITRAQLRLARLEGHSVRRRRVAVPNLLEAVRVMEASTDRAHALYSWNNLNRSGSHFGEGVVYFEELVQEERAQSVHYRELSPKRSLPISLWNRLTIPAFSRAYAVLETRRRDEALLSLEAASFPINGKETYYKLFGRRGFREYQLLIPREAWSGAVVEIESMLRRAQTPVALGSLKLFGGERRLLDFSGEGICLTIDVPNSSASLQLFSSLDRLAVGIGGIVNLSKDSRLSGETARQLFQEYDRFAQAITEHDPSRRFASALSRRIFA